MAKQKESQFIPGDTAQVQGAPEANTIRVEIPDTLESAKPTKKKKKSVKDILKTVGKIKIKPFLDANQENMGLEEYDMVVFPGVSHEEQLAALERNGIVRYVTGLDEFATEVQNIPDDSKRDAVIANIRVVVADLEKRLATNVLDVNDIDFWNKVKLLRPENTEFWEKVSLKVGNEPIHLNPLEDPYDLIKLMAIEAGGFDLVAKSYDDAQSKPKPPKFYLDKETHTVSTKTIYKKLRNKAIRHLDDVYGKNPKKLLYMTKVIDSNSSSYKISTPIDILYEACDEYIAGNGGEKSRIAAQRFIDTAELDMETLKIKALVKDATFFRMITLKPDGMLYHTKTSALLGRNVADIVEFLKNPLNEDLLTAILGEVETLWNN
tara:strand:+ start:1601 stop:2734 length:1134 start_codon:yes stop_codon:yes gene_type:complete